MRMLASVVIASVLGSGLVHAVVKAVRRRGTRT
jgi:hypothetical protein